MGLQQTYQPNRSSRGRFLSCGGVALIAGTVGCTGVVDSLADLALRNINIFRKTDDTPIGTVAITCSADETVLSELFELPPASDGEDTAEKDEKTAYKHVWTDPGTHEASVELKGGLEVQAEFPPSPSISIDDTNEEMSVFGFGPKEFGDSIGFTVGDSLIEFVQSR